ncbi:MAG: hypothetical protein Q9181_004847, partial [Wetmoreana brouardii]
MAAQPTGDQAMLGRQGAQIHILFGHQDQIRVELSDIFGDVGHVAEQIQDLVVHKNTASSQLQFLFVQFQEINGKVHLLSTETDECFDKVITRVSRLSGYTEHVATGLGQRLNDVSHRVDGVSAHYRELEAQIHHLTSIFNRQGVEDLRARVQDVIQDIASAA